MENQNEALVQTLLNCAMACEHCAHSCLQEPDMKKMSRCISLDIDCTDICTQAARLISRNSDIAMQYLVLCEEICRMCADECGKHDHEHCRLCAEACRNCADACHEHHQPVTQD